MLNNEIGNLFVIAAPSGTGKTTLVKALTETIAQLTVSISHTTRDKRPNEMNHQHYHFVTQETFKHMIEQNHFLEYATIFDHYYGTSKTWVNDRLAAGKDVILEIDWQGHQQIKQLMPHAISIFILPPSLKDLEDRLSKRNQDRPEMVAKRLADAAEATQHAHTFDYLVINDRFEQAVNDLTHIILAGRLLQTHQQTHLARLITAFSQ